jgi:isoquinoline 1-oxidoreductase alpha subunit
MELEVNGRLRALDESLVVPQMPLLWVLREVLGLTGTKYGCGVAACGACTVHVDERAVRSCTVPVASVAGQRVRTIEGLAAGGVPHALQAAWIEHQVPQCGYCQSGMLMAAAALLARKTDPSDAEIDAAITNLCRCGSTVRVRAAVRGAAQAMRANATSRRTSAP